jgi:phosphatidylserine/phosphatidylglycerophosphate/cardiolipin synthase-like enzyme
VRSIAAWTTLLLWLVAAPAVAADSHVQLVQTSPVETSLDLPGLPPAHEVWREMIDGATSRIDLAHFYASNQPDSRLETVIQALEAAAARGVQIRFLAEKKFYATYPQTLDRLGALPQVQVRLYDVEALMGGVLHAKMMLIDGREAFVGSQNFDWRALTHIQELGVRIDAPAVVQFYADVFATDWALANGENRTQRIQTVEADQFPVPATAEGETVWVTPVASPQGWLPDEELWDLPKLVAMIDEARTRVRVQLLTYRTVGRDGRYFDDLEAALRRAAARDVDVEMLVADWSKRAGTIEGLQSLQALPHVSVKLVTIPKWSGGFIPYARVIHAKYMVVDGARGWVGTSNWERDYFHASRNVGLLLEGSRLARTLDAFFEMGWNSSYASAVDPCAQYQPPRRN